MWNFILRMLKKYREFILYAIFGCINTLIDFLVFTGTNELLHFPAELCQVFGYLAGFISGFIFNRNITFKKEGAKGLVGQVVRFALVNLVSLGVSTLLIHLLKEAGMNEYIAKILVTVIVVLINFFGYKFFVFRKEKTEAAPEPLPLIETLPEAEDAVRETTEKKGEK